MAKWHNSKRVKEMDSETTSDERQNGEQTTQPGSKRATRQQIEDWEDRTEEVTMNQDSKPNKTNKKCTTVR
jgi:hypothetical protein